MLEMFSPEALSSLFTMAALSAFAQVVMIDLVLAGDNAIIIGLAAAGLPKEQRAKAVMVGVAAATVLRILFAGITTQLLQIVGLLFAGGLLLAWVAYKMYRELRHQSAQEALGEEATAEPKTFFQAATQIVVADISMSLDNVLAVAGAAREHPAVLVLGLALSVVLMGFASTLIARLLGKHRWIAWVGLAVIVYVAIDMMLRGGQEIWPHAGKVLGL